MMTTYDKLAKKLDAIVPDFELREKAKLIDEIEALKTARNAVVLGHNYMEPALYHFVSDFTGDSLELCRKAQTTTNPVIVFCGVEFMAETAKVINPDKTVLIPSNRAGCSLAQAITAEDVRELKRRYPGVPVVTYINTYADVKAETDVCCTSGNAAKVVSSLNSDRVIFIPDEYLAKNVARDTGKTVIVAERNPSKAFQSEAGLEKVFIGWNGKCEVHEKFTVGDIERVRAQFPQVVVLAHPECSPEVVQAADFSGSTAAMIKYVRDVKAQQYLLLTECAMADNVIAENREKEVLRLCSIRCPHMAQITLEDTRDCLEKMRYVVDVPAEVRVRAKLAIDRMLALG